MFAFLESIGFQEMVLLLVIGLLLYGRNLPEAGRKLGKVVAQLRRSFHEFKRQIDQDGDLRDVKNSLRSTADELRRAADLPRAVNDPRRALRQLADEAIKSPPPDEAEPDLPPPSHVSPTLPTPSAADAPAADAGEGAAVEGEAAAEQARTVPRES